MKQHITIEQIKELNSEQMEKLKEILVYSSANFKEGDKFHIKDDTDYIEEIYDGNNEEEKDYTKVNGEYVVIKKNGHKDFDILFPHYEEPYWEDGELYEVPKLSYYVDDIRVFPLLSIGKMIEILQHMELKVVVDNCIPASVKVINDNREYCDMDLCDALWKCIVNCI